MASRIGQLLAAIIPDFLVDTFLTGLRILVKFIIGLPILYFALWVAHKGHPSHDILLGYFLGVLIFTNISQEKRDKFKDDIRRALKNEPVPPPPSRLILPPFTKK